MSPNKSIQKILPIGILYSIVLILLLGCTVEKPVEYPLTTPIKDLVPYLTPTPQKTQLVSTETTSNQPSATYPPLPTPTPILYKIAKDDTLTGIAYRHGVKLTDLIAVNPGIDPNFLTIGITITIPISGSNSLIISEPTPIPLIIEKPNCYIGSDGGQWCLCLVHNTTPADVENVSAQIILQPKNDGEPIIQTALSPLNLLSSGKSIPLVVFFSNHLPELSNKRANLLTVLPVSAEDHRYLTLDYRIDKIDINNEQRQAIIAGEAWLPEGDQKAENVWIVGVAYDLEGQPVGFRKWINFKPLIGGDKISFVFTVSSLGPPIEKVDVLFEARP